MVHTNHNSVDLCSRVQPLLYLHSGFCEITLKRLSVCGQQLNRLCQLWIHLKLDFKNVFQGDEYSIFLYIIKVNGHSWCYMLCTIFQYFSFSNSSVYARKQTIMKKQTKLNKHSTQFVHFNWHVYNKATEKTKAVSTAL